MPEQMASVEARIKPIMIWSSVLLLPLVAILLLTPLNESLFLLLNQHLGFDGSHGLWAMLTNLGDGFFLFPLVMILFLRKPDQQLAVIISMIVLALTVNIAKKVIGAPRPAMIFDSDLISVIGPVVKHNSYGIPLCLLVCSWYRLWEKITRPQPRTPKQVLMVELSEMGSAILVDPVMRWLKEQGCNPHFVIFDNNLPSLKLLNTVPSENIFTIRSSNFLHLALDSVRFLLWCRKKNIDTTIDLELFSRLTSLPCRLSGAVNRAGYEVHSD